MGCRMLQKVHHSTMPRLSDVAKHLSELRCPVVGLLCSLHANSLAAGTELERLLVEDVLESEEERRS